VNIAATALGVPFGTNNGLYHIERATVTNGVVGAYSVIGTVAAIYQASGASGLYAAATYVDTTVTNGMAYSYTVALDNNA